MEADSDSVDDDYKNIPRFVRVIIQTFRISIGDISVNKYGKWANGDLNDKDFKIAQPVAIFIIWILWFINLFVMLIIMHNLVIAQVG
jgi:hypothetical protein